MKIQYAVRLNEHLQVSQPQDCYDKADVGTVFFFFTVDFVLLDFELQGQAGDC